MGEPDDPPWAARVIRFPVDPAGTGRTRAARRVADLGSAGADGPTRVDAVPSAVADLHRGADPDPARQADLTAVGSPPSVTPRTVDVDALGRAGGGPGRSRVRRDATAPDGADRGPTRRPVAGAARGRSAGRRATDRSDRLAEPTGPTVSADTAVSAVSAVSAVPDDSAVPADPADPTAGRATSARARRRGRPAELDPDADPLAVAREICLRLLTDRAHTRAELARALHRRGVPDDAAEQVLGRFDEVGLIDDTAFAAQWVRSRHGARGLGRRAIAAELRRKGVADDVAGDALASVDGDAERERARALVERRLRTAEIDTPERRAVAGRRLVGMLARKGYGPAVAYQVVRDALAAAGADPDELGHAPAPDG